MGFHVPKQQYDYEACCSRILQINFDHLAFFNVHPMHSAQVFLHLSPIDMWLLQPGFETTPSGLAEQQQSHYAATAGGVM